MSAAMAQWLKWMGAGTRDEVRELANTPDPRGAVVGRGGNRPSVPAGSSGALLARKRQRAGRVHLPSRGHDGGDFRMSTASGGEPRSLCDGRVSVTGSRARDSSTVSLPVRGRWRGQLVPRRLPLRGRCRLRLVARRARREPARSSRWDRGLLDVPRGSLDSNGGPRGTWTGSARPRVGAARSARDGTVRGRWRRGVGEHG